MESPLNVELTDCRATVNRREPELEAASLHSAAAGWSSVGRSCNRPSGTHSQKNRPKPRGEENEREGRNGYRERVFSRPSLCPHLRIQFCHPWSEQLIGRVRILLQGDLAGIECGSG